MERTVGSATAIVQLTRESPVIAFIMIATYSLLYFLKEVMNIIDNAFGMIHHWLLHSPASQFGAGLGGTIGLAVGILYHGPWIAVTVGVGLGGLLGGCTCNGIYTMISASK